MKTERDQWGAGFAWCSLAVGGLVGWCAFVSDLVQESRVLPIWARAIVFIMCVAPFFIGRHIERGVEAMAAKISNVDLRYDKWENLIFVAYRDKKGIDSDPIRFGKWCKWLFVALLAWLAPSLLKIGVSLCE